LILLSCALIPIFLGNLFQTYFRREILNTMTSLHDLKNNVSSRATFITVERQKKHHSQFCLCNDRKTKPCLDVFEFFFHAKVHCDISNLISVLLVVLVVGSVSYEVAEQKLKVCILPHTQVHIQ
jgi:hypothetical protein